MEVNHSVKGDVNRHGLDSRLVICCNLDHTKREILRGALTRTNHPSSHKTKEHDFLRIETDDKLIDGERFHSPSEEFYEVAEDCNDPHNPNTLDFPEPLSYDFYLDIVCVVFKNTNDASRGRQCLQGMDITYLTVANWTSMVVRGEGSVMDVQKILPPHLKFKCFIREMDEHDDVPNIQSYPNEDTHIPPSYILIFVHGTSQADAISQTLIKSDLHICKREDDKSFTDFLPAGLRNLKTSNQEDSAVFREEQEKLLLASIVTRRELTAASQSMKLVPSNNTPQMADKMIKEGYGEVSKFTREQLLYHRPPTLPSINHSDSQLAKDGVLRVKDRTIETHEKAKSAFLPRRKKSHPPYSSLYNTSHMDHIPTPPFLPPGSTRSEMTTMSELPSFAKTPKPYYYQQFMESPSLLRAARATGVIDNGSYFSSHRTTAGLTLTTEEVAEIAAEALEEARQRRERKSKSSNDLHHILDPEAPEFWPTGLLPGNVPLNKPVSIETLKKEAFAVWKIICKRRILELCTRNPMHKLISGTEDSGSDYQISNRDTDTIRLDALIPLYCYVYKEMVQPRDLGYRNLADLIVHMSEYLTLDQIPRSKVEGMPQALLDIRHALKLPIADASEDTLRVVKSKLSSNDLASENEFFRCLFVSFVMSLLRVRRINKITNVHLSPSAVLQKNEEDSIELDMRICKNQSILVEKLRIEWNTRIGSVLALHDLISLVQVLDLSHLLTKCKEFIVIRNRVMLDVLYPIPLDTQNLIKSCLSVFSLGPQSLSDERSVLPPYESTDSLGDTTRTHSNNFGINFIAEDRNKPRSSTVPLHSASNPFTMETVNESPNDVRKNNEGNIGGKGIETTTTTINPRNQFDGNSQPTMFSDSQRLNPIKQTNPTAEMNNMYMAPHNNPNIADPTPKGLGSMRAQQFNKNDKMDLQHSEDVNKDVLEMRYNEPIHDTRFKMPIAANANYPYHHDNRARPPIYSQRKYRNYMPNNRPYIDLLSPLSQNSPVNYTPYSNISIGKSPSTFPTYHPHIPNIPVSPPKQDTSLGKLLGLLKKSTQQNDYYNYMASRSNTQPTRLPIYHPINPNTQDGPIKIDLKTLFPSPTPAWSADAHHLHSSHSESHNLFYRNQRQPGFKSQSESQEGTFLAENLEFESLLFSHTLNSDPSLKQIYN